MCDKAILGLSSLDSDACWPLRLFRASYKRHFRPKPLCLTLSLFWSPTLPSLVVDLYSLLFPCDATAAELMCRSVLAACCLRFQGRSHFHTHIMKTCIILTKEPKIVAKPDLASNTRARGILDLSTKNSYFKLWGGWFFLKVWWHWQRK